MSSSRPRSRSKGPTSVSSSNVSGTRAQAVLAPPPTARPWLSEAERNALIFSTLWKTLLFQSYHSTDFEVHRNWLAITYSLPLSKWYFEATSEWTLDYPPFFAYFERVLSVFAYVVDPKIVQLDSLGYEEWSAVAFQRSTVVISELVLAGAVIQWARRSQKPDYPTAFTIAVSLLFHPGLMIVDHIHFQYNGFLLGILLWSIVAARENNLYLCAALFATLLNFKHIFIYLAPPYFVFLLRRHCYDKAGAFQFDRLLELGAIVLSIVAASFGPFLVAGGPSQIVQIFTRLFPFQRGLNHAYWAANVWALVSAVDRVLVKYLVTRGWPISEEVLSSASRGLIGETTFGVLPNVTPLLTFSITLGFILIYLTKLWFDPTYKRFLDAIVLSAMTSFLWGWHVHEKAVLLFLVPLSLTAVEDEDHLRAYIVASCAGVYSLFPLLIKPIESPIKIIFTVLWCGLVFSSLRRVVYRPLPSLISFLVGYAELAYVAGFFVLQFYVGFLHDALFGPLFAMPNFTTHAVDVVAGQCLQAATGALADGACDGAAEVVEAVVESVASNVLVEGKYEFLPLMLTSLYCAVGIVWAWLRLSWVYLIR